MRRTLCVLAIAFLVALSASAVVPPKEDDSILKNRPEWVRAPELGAEASLVRAERGDSRAVDFPGVARFFNTHSENWNVTWDTRSNRAHLIQGPGVAWGDGQPPGDVGLARAFIAENWELFGVDPADLVLDESQSGTFGKKGQLTFITFQQTYEGIPVEDATVFFRINQGKLRSFGTVRVADVHMSTHANVDKDEALRRVLDYAGFAADEVTELLVDGELKIVPALPPGESAGHAYLGAPGLGYRHALAREVSFRREGDDATYEALVDARNGQILKLVDANAYATVTGGVVFDYLSGESVVTFPSNVATTSGPCTSLDGVNFRMNDYCGPINVCDSNDAASGNGKVDMGTSAGHNCSTPPFGSAGNTRSSRTGMYHLTKIRNEADSYHPSNSWLDSKVTANMNINNTCNAYWNGSTVNFYRSGGGCGNTGEIPAVFLHEWGHGFDQNTGGVAPDRASGEAVGDVFAALYGEDSCIGTGFFDSGTCYNCTSCSGVRDLEDFSAYGTKPRATPANVTNNSGINCDRYSCPYSGYAGVMGYQGHCESIIAGSAVWNLTQAIGFPATRDLWYPSLVPSKSYAQIQSGGQCNPSATVNGCGATNWYSVLIDVDDGTYACDIWDAFNAQGIACGSRPSCGGGGTCGEATCVPAQAAYISHFTGTGCTGTESYYLPYDGYAYDCRTWDGYGQCGTIERTVTNRSYRYGGTCYDAWPSGNTLSEFVTVYRACGEASCIPAQGTYISHFTGAGCTGTESYYLPYGGYAYDCRSWDGEGECGTIERTVTNRSYRSGGTCYDAWPSGNTLSEFVTIYR